MSAFANAPRLDTFVRPLLDMNPTLIHIFSMSVGKRKKTNKKGETEIEKRTEVMYPKMSSRWDDSRQ